MENQQKNELQKSKVIEFERNISDSVSNRVNQLSKDGRLNLPANYSVGNAITSAWLILQNTFDKDKRPVLTSCTKESVANALLDMAIMGLNPAKKQGYFIAYGNQLSWFTSYFGKCAALRRVKGFETEPVGTLIYEGDTFELGLNELNEEIITNHIKSWDAKVKNNIIGAYATVKYKGITKSVVMTMREIKEAWGKSKTNVEHKDFTGEYVKRTVINRLVKMLLQTTNDDDLLAENIIQNEDQHYDFSETEVVEETKKEIELNANKGEKVGFAKETPSPEPTIVVNTPLLKQTASSEDFKQTSIDDDSPGY